MDANGVLAFVSCDELLETFPAVRRVRVRGFVALQVIGGRDDGFDHRGMLFFPLFHDNAPLVLESIGRDLFRFKIRGCQHRIQPHSHGKFLGGTSGAYGLSDFRIDNPFKMRDAIRFFLAKHCHYAFC